MTITIYGASDDLIEVRGDLSEEFTTDVFSHGYEGDLLAFSDGTVLRITYGEAWRIVPVHRGTAELAIVQTTESDDGYSDEATLEGPIQWVVAGKRMATAA